MERRNDVEFSLKLTPDTAFALLYAVKLTRRQIEQGKQHGLFEDGLDQDYFDLYKAVLESYEQAIGFENVMTYIKSLEKMRLA